MLELSHPAFYDQEKESVFLIYDREMNLIKKLEYRESYWTMMAWWLLPSSHHMKYNHPEVYENEMNMFSKGTSESA